MGEWVIGSHVPLGQLAQRPILAIHRGVSMAAYWWL